MTASKVKLYNHPDYDSLSPLWVNYRDAYEGDPRVMVSAKYLIKHDLERKKQGGGLFRARQERTAYTNYVEPIVGIWKNIMLSKEPKTETVKDVLPEAEMANVDGKESSLNIMISDVVECILTYGWVYIFVDAPSAGEVIRPYFEIAEPLSVVNWQREYQDPERLGKFNFITRQYCAVRSASSESKPAVVHYRETWVRDADAKVSKQLYTAKSESSTEWEKSGEPIPYPFLKEIPVAAVQDADSWIKDLVPNALKYHNLVSGYENILHFQAYRQTWISSNMPTTDRKAVSEYVINFLPLDSSVNVINSENPIALAEHIKSTELNLYKIGLNILRQVSGESSAVQSVDTLREERKNVIDLIRAELGKVESIINQAISAYAAFKSKAGYVSTVELDKQIDLSAFDILLPMFERLRDEVKRFPTWEKQMLKRFAEEMQPGDLETIKAEIEAAKPVDPNAAAITRSSIFGNISGGR